jgi:hypothetical protein
MKMLSLLLFGFLLLSGTTPLCAPAAATENLVMAADCDQMADADKDRHHDKRTDSTPICHSCVLFAVATPRLAGGLFWAIETPSGLPLGRLDGQAQRPPTPPPRAG